jgi:dTDP-4-dehydrorhamnose reductase
VKNVLVLGGSGMLGSMIVDVLSRESDVAVTATARSSNLTARFQALYPATRWVEFRFDPHDLSVSPSLADGRDWIVNAVGITKPLIRDDNPAEIAAAIAVNAALPHRIGQVAAAAGAKVIQIATDCVYSGAKGDYVESDPHDALDVYGKTKSLGETYLPGVHHLRCSIVGPEPKDPKFLVEWFRRQPAGAQVNGFVNHRWNGVTTLHFARICLGVIRTHMTLPHLQHVVPSDTMTKAGMLHAFARDFDRQDILIRDVQAQTVVDRTLATANSQLNADLWSAAGYGEPPTVRAMLGEMARYDCKATAQSAGV